MTLMSDTSGKLDDMAFIDLAKALAPDQTIMSSGRRNVSEVYQQLVYANALLVLVKELPEEIFCDEGRRDGIVQLAELACDVLSGHEMTMEVIKRD